MKIRIRLKVGQVEDPVVLRTLSLCCIFTWLLVLHLHLAAVPWSSELPFSSAGTPDTLLSVLGTVYIQTLLILYFFIFVGILISGNIWLWNSRIWKINLSFNSLDFGLVHVWKSHFATILSLATMSTPIWIIIVIIAGIYCFPYTKHGAKQALYFVPLN